MKKGDIVYAIHIDEENGIALYRKEKFVEYYNGFPVCTVDMKDGITMGYDEAYLDEDIARLRIREINNKLKYPEEKAIIVTATPYENPGMITNLSELNMYLERGWEVVKMCPFSGTHMLTGMVLVILRKRK